MFAIIFYTFAATALLASVASDRDRTKRALAKAWSAFSGILPEFIMIVVATGLILAFLTPEFVVSVLGENSGFTGVLIASVTGSITLIPGFVAFPMASILVAEGAGILQIGAFVSALMMVGVVTFSLERKTFGTRFALMRNGMAWLFSLAVAGVLALVLGGIG